MAADPDFADVGTAFEVAETAACVLAGGYTRVALQFPDELVVHAAAVHAALSARLPASVTCYILADCTFDGSQLDYVAAQHVDAQLLVHYGGAQLEVSGPIPARLVFPRRHLDVQALAAAIVAALDAPANGSDDVLGGARHVAVLYQLCYAHAMSALDADLRKRAPGRAFVATVPRDFGAAEHRHEALHADRQPGSEPEAGGAGDSSLLVVEGFHLRLPTATPLAACCVLYVGGEDGPLDAIALTHCAAKAGAAGAPQLPELPICLFEPRANEPAPPLRRLLLPTAKRLMRRYYLVQKARDVPTFGLVVATLSARHFRPVLDGLTAALRRAGRRWYVLLVGKLNPAKLANFPDIGMFVLIGGARSAVAESTDFLSPLISPHELLLALGGTDGEWTGEYILDFGRLLPRLQPNDGAAHAVEHAAVEVAQEGSASAEAAVEGSEAAAAPRLSLLTGRLHLGTPSQPHAQIRPNGGACASAGGAVSIAYERTVAQYDRNAGGAAYLLSRSFQGLDPTPGAQPVQRHLPRGRSGVASSYAAEGSAMGAPSPAALLELLAEANSLNELARAEVGGLGDGCDVAATGSFSASTAGARDAAGGSDGTHVARHAALSSIPPSATE